MYVQFTHEFQLLKYAIEDFDAKSFRRKEENAVRSKTKQIISNLFIYTHPSA